ncbi:hypothetical protein LX77_00692 [Gelidibacter algens]|uniref:Uncharacterized protein n=1 Tax=Gelidibacter algens TaxID=49280 RepID=A0A327SFJ2_9FLAO|nr:hypothetical protein LX77_00692 [Gelidibacter algens]
MHVGLVYLFRLQIVNKTMASQFPTIIFVIIFISIEKKHIIALIYIVYLRRSSQQKTIIYFEGYTLFGGHCFSFLPLGYDISATGYK